MDGLEYFGNFEYEIEFNFSFLCKKVQPKRDGQKNKSTEKLEFVWEVVQHMIGD